MNRNQEVNEYRKKYSSKETVLRFPENASFDYQDLIIKLQKSKIVDCPDMFFVDRKTSTIYIFEHFQIDSSKHTKKGSQEKAEAIIDKKKFEERCSLCNENNPEVEYLSVSGVETSVNYYFDSLKTSFEKHRNRVSDYEDHVLKLARLKPDKWRFFVSFVIEDGSLFGSICYGKKPLLLFPTMIKEFMNMFRRQDDVDCLICSSFYENVKQTYAISKKDQGKNSDEKNLSEIQFVEVTPVSYGWASYLPRV